MDILLHKIAQALRPPPKKIEHQMAPLVVGIIRSHLLIRDSGADAFAFIESTSSEGSDHLSRLVQPIIFNVNAYFDVGQLDFR